jgi:hypothetical protein
MLFFYSCLRPLLKGESRIQSKFKTNLDDVQASSDVLNTIFASSLSSDRRE